MSIYQLISVFTFLIFTFGCQQRSELEVESGRAVLTPRPFKVSNTSTIDWRVGPERRQTVSRGFNIVVDLPQLKRDDLRYLIEERGVDSWYLQLHRRSASRMEVLHRTVVPLSLSVGQVKTTLFPIQYAASAISMRMAESPCPNFSHRFLIEGLTKESRPAGLQNLTTSAVNEAYIGGNYVMAEIRPSSINGGNQLQGEYRVEIALFDSRTNRRKSNFMTMSDLVRIPRESIVEIRGCENFKMPDAPTQDMRQFRFGR